MLASTATVQSFLLTNTMVAGTPAQNQSGYNINVGPVIGTLTPNLVNGILCRVVSRVTTPSLFLAVDAVVAAAFITSIAFQSGDPNWDALRFFTVDATFSTPGGDSQWIWDTGQATIPPAFIQGIQYRCDIR